MKIIVKDSIATSLAVLGAVAVVAKLLDYNWWLLDSWKGALGVVAVLSSGILVTSWKEVVSFDSGVGMIETAWWLLTATVVIGGLTTATTKLEFVSASICIAVGYLLQITRHFWRFEQLQHAHYSPAP